MKSKVLRVSSIGLILFSALSIGFVSGMVFISPQAVMDLVQVKLTNTDAYSSIRGVYGGVGLTILITLLYLAFNDYRKGLGFTSLLWGCYALSRVLTIINEGPLGAFGQQWLGIEATLCVLSITLLALHARKRVVAAL